MEQAPNTDEITLKELLLKIKDWWRYLWSKKWKIIPIGLLGGVLGLGLSLISKPTYTATTTFVLESGDKGGVGAYAGIAAMVGIDLGSSGGIFQGDNIIELYKSRTMIEKTLYSLDSPGLQRPLIERFIAMNKMRKSWDKKPATKDLKFALGDLQNNRPATHYQRSKDSVVAEIVKDIRENYLSVAKPDKKLSIIKVQFKAADEWLAKRFNEELVKNVNEFYVYTKTKRSAENVAIMQHKTDSVTAVMNGTIYQVAQIADATPNMNPTRQVQRTAPIQKAQFSAEVNKKVLEELVKNLEISKISLLKETPLIQIIDQPIIPLEMERLRKIKGIIIGGLLAGFLCVLFFSIKFISKNTFSE